MEACRILLLSLTLSPLPLCTLVAFARNDSSTEQLKYRSKRNRQDLILPYLRQCGFRVQNHRILKKGDVEITFSSTEEAHRAYQEAALVNNNFVPFQGADPRLGFLSWNGEIHLSAL